MKYCGKCGNEYKDGKFCTNCGARLDVEEIVWRAQERKKSAKTSILLTAICVGIVGVLAFRGVLTVSLLGTNTNKISPAETQTVQQTESPQIQAQPTVKEEPIQNQQEE